MRNKKNIQANSETLNFILNELKGQVSIPIIVFQTVKNYIYFKGHSSYRADNKMFAPQTFWSADKKSKS